MAEIEVRYSPKLKSWVLVEADKVVGGLDLKPYDPPRNLGGIPVVNVRTVEISDHLRGKGHGGRLYRAVIDGLRRQHPEGFVFAPSHLPADPTLVEPYGSVKTPPSPAAERVWDSLRREYPTDGGMIYVGPEKNRPPQMKFSTPKPPTRPPGAAMAKPQDYPFYVTDRSGRIVSGWEYAQDAQDALYELQDESPGSRAAVSSRHSLQVKLGRLPGPSDWMDPDELTAHVREGRSGSMVPRRDRMPGPMQRVERAAQAAKDAPFAPRATPGAPPGSTGPFRPENVKPPSRAMTGSWGGQLPPHEEMIEKARLAERERLGSGMMRDKPPPLSGRMSEAALDAEMEAIYGPKSTFPEPGLLESGADASGQEYDYWKKSSRRSLIDAERQLKYAYDGDSAAALGRAYRHLNEADATGKYLGDATELRAMADGLLAQIPPEEWERVEGAYFSGERGRTKDAAEALLDARHARGTVSSTASAAILGGSAAKRARQRTAALAAGGLFAGKALRFLGGGALGVAGLVLDSREVGSAELQSPKERALMRDEALLSSRLPPESERFVGPGGGKHYRRERFGPSEEELEELAARMPPSRMISEGDWK